MRSSSPPILLELIEGSRSLYGVGREPGYNRPGGASNQSWKMEDQLFSFLPRLVCCQAHRRLQRLGWQEF